MIYLILGIVVLVILLGVFKKKTNTPKPVPGKTPSNQPTNSNPNQKKTEPKEHIQTEKWTFPDRRDTIVRHTMAIQNAINSGDIAFANLSYAKLIEAIRQQNVNEKGVYNEFMKGALADYELFQQKYDMVYPEEFLPPSERKPKYGPSEDSLVFIATMDYYELPKSILKNVDIVRTIGQWNDLGFKPHYKDAYKSWNELKRDNKSFDYTQASSENKTQKISSETGKRITEKPYHIKTLIDQGCKPEEFILFSEDLPHFFNAVNLNNKGEYPKANEEIETALAIKKRHDYIELHTSIQIKLGNTEVAEEAFKKYEKDIDSVIHTSEIYDWLKAFVMKGEYDKTISYIKKTNDTLDKMEKGIIKPTIYGQQDSSFYAHEKENFNKFLFSIFENITTWEKSDGLMRLMDLYSLLYTATYMNPIEKVADIFTDWQEKEKALPLYQKCLNAIVPGEKPRVKARLEKKISKIELSQI